MLISCKRDPFNYSFGNDDDSCFGISSKNGNYEHMTIQSLVLLFSVSLSAVIHFQFFFNTADMNAILISVASC